MSRNITTSRAAQHVSGARHQRHLWTEIQTTDPCGTACIRRAPPATSVSWNITTSQAAQHVSGAHHQRHLSANYKAHSRAAQHVRRSPPATSMRRNINHRAVWHSVRTIRHPDWDAGRLPWKLLCYAPQHPTADVSHQKTNISGTGINNPVGTAYNRRRLSGNYRTVQHNTQFTDVLLFLFMFSFSI